MPLFRKKPVTIEARLVPKVRVGDGIEEAYKQLTWLAKWSGGEILTNTSSGEFCVDIKTLEGTMRALSGDWIIQGVNGEFYPCKPDIFEKTYEKVLDNSN